MLHLQDNQNPGQDVLHGLITNALQDLRPATDQATVDRLLQVCDGLRIYVPAPATVEDVLSYLGSRIEEDIGRTNIDSLRESLPALLSAIAILTDSAPKISLDRQAPLITQAESLFPLIQIQGNRCTVRAAIASARIKASGELSDEVLTNINRIPNLESHPQLCLDILRLAKLVPSVENERRSARFYLNQIGIRREDYATVEQLAEVIYNTPALCDVLVRSAHPVKNSLWCNTFNLLPIQRLYLADRLLVLVERGSPTASCAPGFLPPSQIELAINCTPDPTPREREIQGKALIHLAQSCGAQAAIDLLTKLAAPEQLRYLFPLLDSLLEGGKSHVSPMIKQISDRLNNLDKPEEAIEGFRELARIAYRHGLDTRGHLERASQLAQRFDRPKDYFSTALQQWSYGLVPSADLRILRWWSWRPFRGMENDEFLQDMRPYLGTIIKGKPFGSDQTRTEVVQVLVALVTAIRHAKEGNLTEADGAFSSGFMLHRDVHQLSTWAFKELAETALEVSKSPKVLGEALEIVLAHLDFEAFTTKVTRLLPVVRAKGLSLKTAFESMCKAVPPGGDEKLAFLSDLALRLGALEQSIFALNALPSVEKQIDLALRQAERIRAEAEGAGKTSATASGLLENVAKKITVETIYNDSDRCTTLANIVRLYGEIEYPPEALVTDLLGIDSVRLSDVAQLTRYLTMAYIDAKYGRTSDRWLPSAVGVIEESVSLEERDRMISYLIQTLCAMASLEHQQTPAGTQPEAANA